MLTRRATAYSSSRSQIVLVYLRPFRHNNSSAVIAFGANPNK